MGLLLTYGFLVMAICFNWILPKIDSKKIAALTFFIISVFYGIIYNYIELYGVIIIIFMFYFAYFYYNRDNKIKYIYLFLFIILALITSLHILPGFNNYNVVKNIKLTSDSKYYSLYLNFDKAAAGFVILFFQQDLLKSIKDFLKSLKKIYIYIILSVLILITISSLFGYIKFEPKVPYFIISFIVSNLFFTCLAEELFFRKIIQENIKIMFINNRYNVIIGIICSALSFGAVHLAGGIKYFIFAFIAGIFYSIIYEKTKNIEMAIIAHFLLNLIHIFLFTYPALS